MVTSGDFGVEHLETLETRDEQERAGRAARFLALTIVGHRDVSRIGDRCRLPQLATSRRSVKVSRLEPRFRSTDGTSDSALGDRYLSRRPIVVTRTAGGVRVERDDDGMSLVVDGLPVEEAISLEDARVDAGVVLEVAGRATLLLHRIEGPRASTPEMGLVGESDAIEQVRREVERVAGLDIPVLLRGESGTGKELVARALHTLSGRAARAYVSVNMAAIPPPTAASELFGHARGAFTGATRDHRGYFLRADGGTLFMDEIAETPPDVQATLLRVLETGEIQPVGANAMRHVDVRLIAATDADLVAAAARGSFRLPLLHRLAGFDLLIPPLRERKDDIARLFVHFLREELDPLGELELLSPERRRPWVPNAVFAHLCRFGWPGNVRQLRNATRQMVVSSRGEEELVMGRAVEQLLTAPRDPQSVAVSPVGAEGRRPADITEDELVEALRENDWRMAATATALGISRASIYRLVDRCSRIRTANEIPANEVQAAFDAAGGDITAMAAQLEVSPRGLKLHLRNLGLSD